MFTSEIRITSIRVRPLMVRLRRPLMTSFGLFSEGPFLAVDLETSQGIVGRVPAFTFHRLGLKTVPPALEYLASIAAAGPPVSAQNVGEMHDRWQLAMRLLGHEGVTQMALSIFDMAVHDALAQANGVPLWQMLGGKAASLQSYNSCGLGIAEPGAVAREAKELVSEHGGFTHIKMRLGRNDATGEVAAIRAVREAIGPAVTLSVDYNQALPAVRALDETRAIDDLGLAWIEEPVPYDDYPTQAALTAKLRTPVQVGETWWHWRVAERAMAMRASDYIMPDLLRIGGITGWLRVARAAAAHGIPMSSHLSPEYSAHALAATPTAHWLEFMDWGQDLLAEPLVPRAGMTALPTTPGAGIAWNEAVVGRYEVRA